MISGNWLFPAIDFQRATEGRSEQELALDECPHPSISMEHDRKGKVEKRVSQESADDLQKVSLLQKILRPRVSLRKR